MTLSVEKQAAMGEQVPAHLGRCLSDVFTHELRRSDLFNSWVRLQQRTRTGNHRKRVYHSQVYTEDMYRVTAQATAKPHQHAKIVQHFAKAPRCL